MKKIAANLSFVFKGQFVVYTEIMVDIIDELRRDRKIKMAISDSEYVKQYLTVELEDANNIDEDKQSPFMKKILLDKQIFKQ
jgi:hypothetical protein